jgi:hypothetical protein
MGLRPAIDRYPSPDEARWNQLFDIVYAAEGPELPATVPDGLAGDLVMMLFVGLCMPDLEWFHGLNAVISRQDCSWARVYHLDDGEPVAVRQGGPRRLWDQLVDTCRLWADLGRPRRDRYGMTIMPDRRQVMWLDRPDSQFVWEL